MDALFNLYEETFTGMYEFMNVLKLMIADTDHHW